MRTIDALLWLAFAVTCFALAGSNSSAPAGLIPVGLVSLAYSAYIGFSRRGYIMPLVFYAVAVFGILGGIIWIFQA
jgi:hypothetical protein